MLRSSGEVNVPPPSPQPIQLTLSVSTEAQARELEAAWREIASGNALPRTEALETDQDVIMERARTALRIIEKAIGETPLSGQAHRLVRFLAAIYNGYDYAFDLAEFRALDTELANACLNYLNYDRLAKQEVHRHLTGGDRQLQAWIQDSAVAPRLILNDEQFEPFMQLVERSGRSPNDLLREAMEALLDESRLRRATRG
jgi:hypothetical protein